MTFRLWKKNSFATPINGTLILRRYKNGWRVWQNMTCHSPPPPNGTDLEGKHTPRSDCNKALNPCALKMVSFQTVTLTLAMGVSEGNRWYWSKPNCHWECLHHMPKTRRRWQCLWHVVETDCPIFTDDNWNIASKLTYEFKSSIDEWPLKLVQTSGKARGADRHWLRGGWLSRRRRSVSRLHRRHRLHGLNRRRTWLLYRCQLKQKRVYCSLTVQQGNLSSGGVARHGSSLLPGIRFVNVGKTLVIEHLLLCWRTPVPCQCKRLMLEARWWYFQGDKNPEINAQLWFVRDTRWKHAS